MILSGWRGMESADKEAELQTEEETGYKRFPLAGTSANIHRSARGLSSVRAARGGAEGVKGKREGGVMRVHHKRSPDSFPRWVLSPRVLCTAQSSPTCILSIA